MPSRYAVYGHTIVFASSARGPPTVPEPQIRSFQRNDETLREKHVDTAAEAWMSLEMTIEAMRHNSRCHDIALEYAARLAAELEADRG